LSFAQLKDLSDRLTQLLPSVKDSVAALDQDMKSRFENARQEANALEGRYRNDLEDLKDRIEQLGEVKDFVDGEEDRQAATRAWQLDLKSAVRSMQSATEMHLEFQVQNLKASIKDMVEEAVEKKQMAEASSAQTAKSSALQLLGTGIASALGAIITIAAQQKSTRKETGSAPLFHLAPKSQALTVPTTVEASPVRHRLTTGEFTTRWIGNQTPWIWSEESQIYIK